MAIPKIDRKEVKLYEVSCPALKPLLFDGKPVYIARHSPTDYADFTDSEEKGAGAGLLWFLLLPAAAAPAWNLLNL